MSALPRPDVTGAARVLNDGLHHLHHRAGWPSLRTLARETGVRTDDASTPASTGEWLVRARRLPTTIEVSLTALTRAETADQLAMVLQRDPGATLVEAVYGRGRGLPLFTEQLAGAGQRLETHVASAEVHLWRADPAAALELLLTVLDEVAPTGDSRFVGHHLVLAARAAADLVAGAGDKGRARELGERLVALSSSFADAPFGTTSFLADAVAQHATWSAELARLAGTQTVDVWATAAAEWDQLTRPHNAAYCRWRGAQVALRDGQGTVAARLLKRAATDAREHVPLTEAIATTSAGVR